MAAKFKVGDTVRRTGDSHIDVEKGKTYIVAKYTHKSIKVVGSTHYYDAAAFELADARLELGAKVKRVGVDCHDLIKGNIYTVVAAQKHHRSIMVKGSIFYYMVDDFELVNEGENQMSTKFNRWDKVIRIHGNHGNTYEGGTYIVAAVSGKNLMLQGDNDFTYYVDSFKLVSAAKPVLTTEGAAIALVEGKPIQYWHCGEWLDFTNLELPWTEVRTLINSAKLRLKPTPMVVINGVELVAPIQDVASFRNTHSNDERVYRLGVDLTDVVSHHVRDMHTDGTYWETSQDAARALKEIRKALTTIIPE